MVTGLRSCDVVFRQERGIEPPHRANHRRHNVALERAQLLLLARVQLVELVELNLMQGVRVTVSKQRRADEGEKVLLGRRVRSLGLGDRVCDMGQMDADDIVQQRAFARIVMVEERL